MVLHLNRLASRVEIEGQFNVDFAACSSSQPIRVERQPATISTISIRNWNKFCDSLDGALMPLAGIRSLAKLAAIIYCVSLPLLVIGMTLPLLQDFDYGLLKYAGAAIYPVVLVYLYVYCQVRKKLAAVMEKAKEITEQFSVSGVTYTLEAEHWGRCNKPHVKRYYILVEVVNEVDISADVEQQNQPADMTVAGYFSTTDPQETNAAGTTSLADLLK